MGSVPLTFHTTWMVQPQPSVVPPLTQLPVCPIVMESLPCSLLPTNTGPVSDAHLDTALATLVPVTQLVLQELVVSQTALEVLQQAVSPHVPNVPQDMLPPMMVNPV